MNAEIRAALDARKPEIARSYTAYITRTFERLVEDLGPELKGVYSNWRWSKVYRDVLSPFVRFRVLNTERLEEWARQYADQAVEAWESKINEKLGELENAEARYFDGAGFTITGTRGGRQIRITQQQVLKWSKNGTPFHQWPSRIYVDGKFTPEAAYKKLFA